MVITHIITHGLFYGAVVTGYLILFMITFSPRVWGYKDYPDIVKRKVPAQTRKEKTLGDLVLLDWLVISKITPKFVIIPGSVKEDYKDFSHHFKGHAKAAVPMIVLGLIIAGLASLL